MEFSGELEIHITVALEGAAGLDALARWGAERDLRCIHILLDRGTCPSQPMLTRRCRGGLSGVLAAAEGWSRDLAAEGFQVTRVKVEAAPGNDGVPMTSSEALALPGRYFEHHVKLFLDPEPDCTKLASIAEAHSAHLSRNALRLRPDGKLERFVTQRCYSVGRPEARRRLEALLDAIRPLGHPVLNVEEEFVVHDSHPAVDAGWIAAGPLSGERGLARQPEE